VRGRGPGFGVRPRSSGFGVRVRSAGFAVLLVRAHGLGGLPVRSAGFAVLLVRAHGFSALLVRAPGFAGLPLRGLGFAVVPPVPELRVSLVRPPGVSQCARLRVAGRGGLLLGGLWVSPVRALAELAPGPGPRNVGTPLVPPVRGRGLGMLRRVSGLGGLLGRLAGANQGLLVGPSLAVALRVPGLSRGPLFGVSLRGPGSGVRLRLSGAAASLSRVLPLSVPASPGSLSRGALRCEAA